MRDPRIYQIGSLAALLTYGLTILGFDVTAARAAAIIATALLTQAICSWATKIPFEPKSALISALSLCLLLRSNHIGFLLVAAVIAIASKFVIRIKGKHVFNPTNGAIVAMMLLTDRVWVSPGQWGNVAFFAFLMLCIGGLVVNRARRSDVTYAFIAAWAAILIGRSLLLGEPMDIPLHRLQNGALLLFTFFMISDPKTTPDTRAGRILFAALVATGAWYVQFKLFRTNGLLWSLAICSTFVPVIDHFLRGDRYEWLTRRRDKSKLPIPELEPVMALSSSSSMKESLMKTAVVALVIALAAATPASAFCGFYVAKGDAKIFNRASQVVLVRDGDRTVMTMANDFRGDPKEFAVVIPVPTLIQRGQINVADKALIDHLDAYSAPRLVEYHDSDPCAVYMMEDAAKMRPSSAPTVGRLEMQRRAKSLGVTIEAQYTVGEYDILILSAKQSNGLETWLVENGYSIPKGASSVLGSYIRQNMKFFVAKVNLTEKARLGFSYLRPIQVAYESPKYMLPVRLGTVNAMGPQELFVYALTRNGRVESTNYRTVKLPSDMDLPVYVRDRFSDFYRSMFSEQVRREDMATIFLEYAWNMNWCDPCAADPLSHDELRRLGVFWLGQGDSMRQMGGAANVFVTRLHARYDRASFPEDIVFQSTGDTSNFQARYVLRHPWTGNSDCPAARQYRQQLAERREREALNLSHLTGWKLQDIRQKMNIASISTTEQKKKSWWEDLWDED